MFCPQCGAENSRKLTYCSHCGLHLAGARLSLEGGVDEALTKHKGGEALFCSGGITLVIFIIAAIANSILNPGWNLPVLVNLILGLSFAIPLMTTGVVFMRRANRVLHPKNEQAQLSGDDSRGARALTSSVDSTSPLSPMKAPDSVTEQTTVNLRLPEQERR